MGNTFALFLLTITSSLLTESEAVNPPGWVGMTLFLVALIMPIIVGMWVRNRS